MSVRINGSRGEIGSPPRAAGQRGEPVAGIDSFSTALDAAAATEPTPAFPGADGDAEPGGGAARPQAGGGGDARVTFAGRRAVAGVPAMPVADDNPAPPPSDVLAADGTAPAGSGPAAAPPDAGRVAGASRAAPDRALSDPVAEDAAAGTPAGSGPTKTAAAQDGAAAPSRRADRAGGGAAFPAVSGAGWAVLPPVVAGTSSITAQSAAGPAPPVVAEAVPPAAIFSPVDAGAPPDRARADLRGGVPEQRQPVTADPVGMGLDAAAGPPAALPQPDSTDPAANGPASDPTAAAALAPGSIAVIATLPDAGGPATGNGDGRDPGGAADRSREATVFAVGAGDATGAPAASGAVMPQIAAPAGIPAGPSEADAGPAGLADRLSGQVARLLAGSSREAVIRLTPPELGEVTVRVAVSGRDVSAWFGTPQPSVQQTISLAIGQLHADLGNAGYTLNGAWVGADASGSGAGGAAIPLPARRMPGAGPDAAPPGVSAALPATSGVSIYV